MGGDEFVIVASHITPSAIEERATLLSDLAQEAGRQVCGRDFLSLSMGAAFYPQDGLDAECLLSEADRRMYAVKNVHRTGSSRNSSRTLREDDELLVG